MSQTTAQLATFAINFAGGWVVCMVFCLVARLVDTTKPLVRYLAETMVGVGCLAFVWWLNLMTANGQFRLVFVVAILLGGVIYVTICKEILDKIVRLVYNFFTKKR